MHECDLILVRGVSGSGKNTISELVATNDTDVVIATDDMFMDKGEYVFDKQKLSMYHQLTINKVEAWMKEYDEKIKDTEWSWFPINRLFVCNTFTTEWEMKPYFELAKKYEWNVHTIIVENRHGSDSIHDVPGDVIDAQRERFQVVL